MMLDIFLAKDGICEGFAFVTDMKGASFSHLTRINIFMMRKLMHYVQVLIVFTIN